MAKIYPTHHILLVKSPMFHGFIYHGHITLFRAEDFCCLQRRRVSFQIGRYQLRIGQQALFRQRFEL